MRTKIEHYSNVVEYGLPTVIKVKDIWCDGVLFVGIKLFYDSLPPKRTAYAISYNGKGIPSYIQKKDNSESLYGTFVTGKRLPIGDTDILELEFINNYDISIIKGEEHIRTSAQKHVLLNHITQLIKDKTASNILEFEWPTFDDTDIVPSAPEDTGKIQKIIAGKQGLIIHSVQKGPTGYVRTAKLYEELNLSSDWLKNCEKELLTYFNQQ